MKGLKLLKNKVLALALACAVIVGGLQVMPSTAVSAAVSTVPTALTFTQNSDTSCTITWKAVSGATYNIYEADSRYATYKKVDTADTNSYTDDSYTDGYYKVTAVVNGKESGKSEAISYEIQTFGYNTNIFEDTDNTNEIQSYIDNVYKKSEAGQFNSERYAFMFKPGTYSNNLNVKIGFYTQVAGMGISPEDTTLGNIRCQAEWMVGRKYDGSVNYNALCNFWRSVENLTTTSQSTMWAVSQATSMRRMNIKGNLDLHEQGGYASGGFLADSKVAGRTYTYRDNKTGKTMTAEAGISSGSQQQWLSRNVEANKWDGSVWNYVFVGCEFTSLLDKDSTVTNGPNGEWPYAAYTKVSESPEIQEKPFLVYNNGAYGVFVPKLRENAKGVSWDGDTVEGETIPLDQFYIAKPTDTAAKINAEIANGKNLILTPGIYEIDQAINIKNEDTVVLGLGYATLKPTKGNQCMTVSDVGGVIIAGVLFDAGRVKSQALLTVGTKGSTTDNSDNPITLSDTFFRVGGADATPCKTTSCVIINSSNVIGDNFWVWRADHGAGVAWDKNTCDYGVIINGNDVITYGLMVEHFQKYQTQWNGNGGKCYMYQSELPYDIGSQASWNAPGSYGYTDYKVASNVKTHEGYGIGIYSCYQTKGSRYLKSAIECPDTPGVKFTNVCTYSLSGNGSIDYAINKSGYAVFGSSEMCKIMSYCNGKYTSDRTYEKAKKYIWSTQVDIAGKSKYESSFKVAYTGKAITPKVTVSYKGIPLRQGIDYTVTYSNNKKMGKAKLVIRGINNFKDSDSYTFKIVPKRAKITKKKATKKKVTVKYAKVKGAIGYEVSYSTTKSFKKKKTVTVKRKKLKCTFKKKEKKAYYVRVRAYYKKGKTVIYGKYSKKVKIKK